MSNKKFLVDRKFVKMIMPLVVPMALQNLINVGVTSADVLMLSKVGENALSGVSLANQISFVLILVFYGLSSGTNVLTSQYWGKRDIHTIEKIMGIGIKMSFIISLLFCAFGFFLPDLALKIFTNDEAIIAEGVKYLRIASFSYIFSSITVVYLNIMRSVERVTISTVIYATSLVTNVIINYILIFGKLGMPELGAMGAAIGTLIARFVELMLVFYYDSRNKNFVRIKLKNILENNKILKQDFYKYSIPVVLNELLWSLSVAASSTIIGRISSSFVAANSITGVVRQFVMIVTFGIANAAAIVVGRTIGEKQMDKALTYARQFTQFALISGIIGATIMKIVAPFVVKYFAINANVAGYLSFMLDITTIIILIQSVTVTLIVGIFRAGGDTKFSLMADTFSSWGCSLILAGLAAFYFKWPAKIVFIFLMSDEPVKLPLVLWRYRSKKWLRNVTRDEI